MASRTLVSPRLLPGLILTAAGALLLLDNLDVLALGDLARWWPLLLVAFGLHVFLEGRNRLLGSTLVAAAVVLQLRELDLIEIPWRTLADLWPLLLVALGVHLLVRRGGRENTIGGVALITLGIYFLGSTFQVIQVPLWSLWPVALIALGVWMLRHATGR